ncbi:MAG: rhodanese-like domain-containing protein [Acidobacteria bacterium]|nr:MAG: rhodanese-like domain-containing protein [Acidobacteriota bacterium]
MKEVKPQDAYAMMQKDPDVVYLDVRSIPEFEQGHPERAINIPLLHFTPGMGMRPNEDFISVVESNIPKEAKVLVGCRSGPRSAQACEIMSQLGYSDVANVRGGYAGVVDHFGRMVEPGWNPLKLPECQQCNVESRYDSLKSKSKK